MKTLNQKAKQIKEQFLTNKDTVLKFIHDENPRRNQSAEEVYYNLILDTGLDYLDMMYPQSSDLRHVSKSFAENSEFWKFWCYEWSLLESMYLNRIKRGASFQFDEWQSYMSFNTDNEGARVQFSQNYLTTLNKITNTINQ